MTNPKKSSFFDFCFSYLFVNPLGCLYLSWGINRSLSAVRFLNLNYEQTNDDDDDKERFLCRVWLVGCLLVGAAAVSYSTTRCCRWTNLQIRRVTIFLFTTTIIFLLANSNLQFSNSNAMRLLLLESSGTLTLLLLVLTNIITTAWQCTTQNSTFRLIYT